jgi:flagellin-specific chaperone FliS
VQTTDVSAEVRDKLKQLIMDTKAARDAYEKYTGVKWAADSDKERTRIAYVSLIDKIDCMYETYRKKDYQCPNELEKRICSIKEQADIIEKSLEAEEVYAAESELCDIFDALDSTLDVLAEKLGVELSSTEEEKEYKPPKLMIIDDLLALVGIKRKK